MGGVVVIGLWDVLVLRDVILLFVAFLDGEVFVEGAEIVCAGGAGGVRLRRGRRLDEVVVVLVHPGVELSVRLVMPVLEGAGKDDVVRFTSVHRSRVCEGHFRGFED